MIIEEIQVKDFRSHGNTKVALDQGITVIIGENGSGKTSLLEAVNFALFKQRPSNVNIDDLVRRGTSTARVVVKFHTGGRAYRVVRERSYGKKTSSSLYLVDGGRERVQAQGEAEVNRDIMGVLDMRGDLFTSAVYIKQGEIDALISAEPAKRKAHISKLIGAENLEKAYQRMRELVYHYDSKVREYSSIPMEVEKLEARMKEEDARISLLGEKLRVASENLAKKNSLLGKKELELRGIERYLSLEKDIKNKDGELRSLLDKIALIDEYGRERKVVQKSAEKYLKLEDELKGLRDELSKLSELRGREAAIHKELDNYQAQVKGLDSSLQKLCEKYSLLLGSEIKSAEGLDDALRKALEKLENERGSARKEVEKVSSRINELKGRTLELQKAVEELSRAEGKCPVCSSPLTREHKEELLEEYDADLAKNSKDIAAYEDRLEELVKKEKNLDSELQHLLEVNVEVLRSKQELKDTLKADAGRLLEDLSEVQKSTGSIKGIEEEIASKEGAKALLREERERFIEAERYLRKNAPDKEGFLEACETLKKDIHRLSREVKSIASEYDYTPDESRAEFVRRELEDVRKEVTTLEKEKSRLEQEILVRKETIEEAETSLDELVKKKLEGEKLAHFVVFLERVRSLFHKDRLQRELRARAKPLIEKYTREIFDEFGLPYSDLALGEDFDLKLYSIAGEESADMLSGGERIASALALRLGISKALAGSATELIMLDEPTIHLDAMRRRELVEIIRKLATIPQTIVVTHDREFEGAADKLLLVKKVAGVSKVAES